MLKIVTSTLMNKKPLSLGPMLIFAVLLTALGSCRGKPTPTPLGEPAVPTVGLDQPEVTSLGKLEGPYYFSQALSPTVIELTSMDAKNESFKLIGLSDNDYSTAPPSAAASSSTPTQPENKPTETPEAIKQRQDQIKAFKMEGLKSLCGTNKLWLLRVPTDQPPNLAYLFLPLSSQSDNQRLTGSATLINAQALRQGLANIDLDGEDHPFFPMMLDCQLASIIQSAQAKKSDTLWSKFEIKMPPGPQDDRMAELEKQIR